MTTKAAYFDSASRTYDDTRFLWEPARLLAVIAQIKTGQRVLDVACGTGWATMAAARATGDTGRIIGIDISQKMLDIAKQKAASARLSNVEYRPGDAEALEFADAVFDAVICASSIFFLQDIPKALREWRRVLKTGGTVAFTSFGERFLQPVLGPLGQRLSRYDGQPPPVPSFINRTDTPDKCQELLKLAGFKVEDIVITTEELGGYLPDLSIYWQQIKLSFVGPRLARMKPADLEKFKAEHLSEMKSMVTNRGIRLEIPTHFSRATKRA
jgi:ubiquinone/menaquinone biosynthesis C-methylase UbiE